MTKQIELTQGKVAIIDDEDFELVSKYKWSFDRRYAKAKIYLGKIENCAPEKYPYKYQSLYMHRLVANAPSDMDVDHINGDGLDNRKSNIRICSHKENTFNQYRNKNNMHSKYKGVTLRSDKKKWVASIMVDSQTTYLGSFDTEELAAQAYNNAAIKFFGEFANLNNVTVQS